GGWAMEKLPAPARARPAARPNTALYAVPPSPMRLETSAPAKRVSPEGNSDWPYDTACRQSRTALIFCGMDLPLERWTRRRFESNTQGRRRVLTAALIQASFYPCYEYRGCRMP